MNQRQIEIFDAVMRNGTTLRAADVMGMSQPAVSKAIQQLEASVGFALFDRGTGRMRPTAEAQLLHQEVEASFTGMTQLRGAAARIRDFGSGQIRIACLSALSINLVPQALRAFHRQHPTVAITLQVLMSATVRDLVASGRFDFGIAADEIDTSGVESTPFTKYPAVIATYPGHRLSQLGSITPADLHDENFIALAPEDTTRQAADKLFAEQEIQPRVVLETPHSSTVCAMVRARLGVGLVNPATAELYAKQGIILKPFTPKILFRTLLLTPPGYRPSRIVRDCIRHFMNIRDLDPIRLNSDAKEIDAV